MKTKHLLLFFFLIPIVIFSVSSFSQKVSTPEIKVVGTASEWKKFSGESIHPDRYILTQDQKYAPVIYDLQTTKTIRFPRLKMLPGLPVAPDLTGKTSLEIATKKSALLMQGGYFTWGDITIVSYNAQQKRAGFVAQQTKVARTSQDTPVCRTCNNETKFVEKYSRYYCYTCSKYIDEKEYTSSKEITYFGMISTETMKLDWLTELERNWGDINELEGISPLGVDPEGKYFYYSNNIYFWKTTATTGKIRIHRFNIADRVVDKKYEIPIPVRTTSNTSSGYSLHHFCNADRSMMVFWEYDEAGDTPGKGYLSAPSAQAIVFRPKDGLFFTVDCPVTAYGQEISHDGKYVILASNQTGEVLKINVEAKKIDQRTTTRKTVFKAFLSQNEKYLFIMNKKTVEVLSWPDLKPFKSIPLGTIFPGVKELLVGEEMWISGDGTTAAIGILQKAAEGPWWASDLDKGFQILKISE